MPAISVIVTIYKVEKYLHRCLDSILDQTFTDFELILVEDGSPDNCLAICNEYAARDCRVRVIHQENSGVSKARNVGLQFSKSNYVTFVDGDDYLEAYFLNEALNDMVVLNLDIYISGHKKVTQTGVVESCTIESDLVTHTAELTESQAIALLKNNYITSCWGKVISRQFIGSTKFDLRMNYGEDLKFIHELLAKPGRIKAASKNGYCFDVGYKNENNLSAIINEEKSKSVVETYCLLFSKKYISDGIEDYRKFVEKRWVDDFSIIQSMILNRNIPLWKQYKLLKLLKSDKKLTKVLETSGNLFLKRYAGHPTRLLMRKTLGRLKQIVLRKIRGDNDS